MPARLAVWLAHAPHGAWASTRADWLDPTEQARYRALMGVAEAQANTFMLARVLRRHAVAQFSGTPAEAWSYLPDAGGKPQPHWLGSGRALPIAVSLAHTGPTVVVAVTDAGQLGVDVENPERYARRLTRAEALVQRYGTAEALMRWRALPDTDRALGCCQWWVQKEALLKMTGQGLRGAWAGAPTPVALGPLQTPARWAHSEGPPACLVGLVAAPEQAVVAACLTTAAPPELTIHVPPYGR